MQDSEWAMYINNLPPIEDLHSTVFLSFYCCYSGVLETKERVKLIFLNNGNNIVNIVVALIFTV